MSILDRNAQSRKLRKQPKVKRVQTAAWVAHPRALIPETAQQRRHRNKKRVHWPTAALKQIVFSARWVSLALLAACIYGLVLIGGDERFYLTTIPVDGVAAISPAEIVDASGLGGVHIFAADPVAAAVAIGQAPGVISTTVVLHWPNQVSITVVEDSPIAIWEQAGESYWINEHGRLIPARKDVAGLLHIYSEQLEPVGDLTFVPPDVLYGALQLVELRPNIEKLYYRPSGGLSYQDGRGWRVYFGSGLDMAQKLVVYETIVDDLVRRGVRLTYISVSNQAKPFYGAN
jgi:cell division septal protein FtsQ